MILRVHLTESPDQKYHDTDSIPTLCCFFVISSEFLLFCPVIFFFSVFDKNLIDFFSDLPFDEFNCGFYAFSSVFSISHRVKPCLIQRDSSHSLCHLFCGHQCH